MPKSPRYNILIVDDNPAEIRLMQEAIKDAGLDKMVDISYATDGEEACRLITSFFVNNKKPDVIFLDLNMPRMGGKEVLNFVKGHPSFENIPVFVITNSDYKRDMIDCYNLKADGYFQKPTEFRRLVDFFVSVKQSIQVRSKISVFWIEKTYAELSGTT